MTEEIQNIVLIRLNEIRKDNAEIKARLSSIEEHMVIFQRDIARLNKGYDTLDARLHRIEDKIQLLDN